MSVFADSSAVVELYADEADSGVIRALDVLVVSELARVEVTAVLWRKVRTGELSTTAATVLAGQLARDLAGSDRGGPRLLAVAVTSGVLSGAARLSGVHGLRAYDAVQLATAAAVREAEPSCATFAAFDRDLRSAAGREGFALLP